MQMADLVTPIRRPKVSWFSLALFLTRSSLSFMDIFNASFLVNRIPSKIHVVNRYFKKPLDKIHNVDYDRHSENKDATQRSKGGKTMNALVKQQDQDFIARFLATYKSLSEESQNLVLAFVRGMEFQRELEQAAPKGQTQAST